MDYSSSLSSLSFHFNSFRASANSFLSQYEPLLLLLAPLFSLILAHLLRSFFNLIHERGLKASLLGFLMSSVKLIPGVKSYIDREKQKVVDKMQSDGKSKREGWRTELPSTGLGTLVLEKMKEEKRKDVAWQGKCSGTVYIGGSEIDGHFSLINEACSMFAHTNPLHLDVFQSVGRFEAEVVAMTAALLGSQEKSSGGQVCGNMTSGGTESILLAVKSSRDYMKSKKGITRPEMIIPVSAHSAYDKAAQYFNIKLWRVAVNKDFQADVKAIRRHINKNTILIVGSAPGFPHGIIDPIEELGQLASSFGICLHVDLCLGGFVLPFARELGYPIPPFDFSVKGVSSISVDVHKYGLAPKGTSIVLYRDHEIRKVSHWPGHKVLGIFEAPTEYLVESGFVLFFRISCDPIHQFVAVPNSTYLSGLPMICFPFLPVLVLNSWYMANQWSFCSTGYLENTKTIMEATKRIQKGIEEISELYVVGRPDMTIVAFGSNVLDIFEVNDLMTSKGWHLNALQRPNSIHICVTLQHVPVVEDFLTDLKESVNTVKENPGPISGGLAPIYGAAGKMPDRGMVQDLLVDYMDGTC
ncbi:sphingosine-1-phosphate lyase [Arachis duranensis]|uniref:Sphingosine-1-phosphate lyase n=1 Tax=Arachis duranensis TaxID=130453 RepID=A0A9C6TUA7_ARADU|nr:sphingosine-1-phosphate lyase [Arachis duranensis]